MTKVLSICIGCHFCFCSLRGFSQNLDEIGKKNSVHLSGGLSLSQVFYTSFGDQNRRDPYSYVASGNVNCSIYGWNVPLTFTLSNAGTSFHQPFNQYSVHPTYKSLQAHLGFVSASYSPYTVSGHLFLGAAADFIPEASKINVSAFYGRLIKGIRYDSVSENAQPAYTRFGYGAKVVYTEKSYSLQLNLFHAEDDFNSVGYIPDSLNINPQENFVWSLSGSKVLFNKFSIRGEWASSAVTDNTNAEVQQLQNLFSKLRPLYTTRLTSAFYNAYKAGVDYQHQNFVVGIGFEHIDPGYHTFGAYYFNSDLENVTLNLSTSLFQGKMSLAASIGSQHDNLNDDKVSTMSRSVGSVTINYAASEKLSMGGSYSSFQTFTNIRSQFQEINQLSPYENIDTLNFTQLSQSANLNLSYRFGKVSQRKQSINANCSMQGASDEQNDVEQNTGARFYNVNTTYMVNFQPTAATLSVSFNASLNDVGHSRTQTFGPVVSMSKSFREKKLKANFSAGYNQTRSTTSIHKFLNIRLGGSLTIRKVHSLSLSVVGTKRQLAELTAIAGYSYSFSSLTFKRPQQ